MDGELFFAHPPPGDLNDLGEVLFFHGERALLWEFPRKWAHVQICGLCAAKVHMALDGFRAEQKKIS